MNEYMCLTQEEAQTHCFLKREKSSVLLPCCCIVFLQNTKGTRSGLCSFYFVRFLFCEHVWNGIVLDLFDTVSEQVSVNQGKQKKKSTL